MPPPVADLYLPCILLQRSSTELLVYSPHVHQVVIVAWPTKTHGNSRIPPERIREWLCRHGLFWCCFCPLEFGEPVSCQIVHCKDGTVKAYCTDFPSKCGFRMNLTNIYYSAWLTSEYPHLPTLASGRKPDIEDFALAFQSGAPFEPGPYFEGYCGEHVSQYHDKEQKAGPFRHPENVEPRYQPYNVDQSIVQARQRSTMDLESATLAMHANALRNRHVTTSLAATRIIPKRKPGLTEQCGICKLYFTGGVLHRHIFVCPSLEV